MSRIKVISRPAACKALTAVSLPAPGPHMSTSAFFTP